MRVRKIVKEQHFYFGKITPRKRSLNEPYGQLSLQKKYHKDYALFTFFKVAQSNAFSLYRDNNEAAEGNRNKKQNTRVVV